MLGLNRLLFDDDDDEDDLHDTGILFVLLYLSQKGAPRMSYHVRDRIEWGRHVEVLGRESPLAFQKVYRMNLVSFNKLCAWIDPFVRVDPGKSHNRTGKKRIDTKIVLHCLLRWLAGGSHHDIRMSAGVSPTAFYNCLDKATNAILNINQLEIKFPSTPGEIEKSAADFRAISTSGIVDGCVGCLDGILIRIRPPWKDETGNVLSYRSGHYNCFGINVQAVCDSRCRFIYASLAAPGRSADVVALRKTSLAKTIEQLPLGRYVIGDNAYVCTEHLLTPFPGEQRKAPENDAYNFYLSQLRIRIEMTFGRFMNRWRLFNRPLQLKLKNVGRIFICAARLHNFCSDERSAEGGGMDQFPATTISRTWFTKPTRLSVWLACP